VGSDVGTLIDAFDEAASSTSRFAIPLVVAAWEDPRHLCRGRTNGVLPTDPGHLDGHSGQSTVPAESDDPMPRLLSLGYVEGSAGSIVEGLGDGDIDFVLHDDHGSEHMFVCLPDRAGGKSVLEVSPATI
jgi:hypothetical protein